MHSQLMLLLEIQDLRSQRKALESESGVERVEAEHFHIDTGEALERLNDKIAQLEDRLEDSVRVRYDRVRNSLDRVVVPVINGACYGCFVSIPTATYKDHDPNDEVRNCEHCGRFIYVLN